MAVEAYIVKFTDWTHVIHGKTWVKTYLDNDNHGKWKLLFDSELHDLGGDVIFKGNLHKNDLSKFIHISDAFITELLKLWSEISYDGNITSSENLLLFGKIHL